MERIQIFCKPVFDQEDADALTKEVNDWFEMRGDTIEVTEKFSSSSSTEPKHRVTITIFYRDLVTA